MTNPAAAKDKTEAGTGLFDRLEVIDDPQPRSAAFNMAADEALLDQIGDTAVLRIYRWQQPAISFGYFTALRDVPRPEAQRALVRRWTGGGIVEHGEDFTYSLVLPAGELRALGAPGRSYELIHQALARALALGGIETNPTCESRSASDRSAAGARCFGRPVPHDLLIAGRKTAGAAQRRTRRGLLHQGSVQGIDPGAGGSSADWKNRLGANFPKVLAAFPTTRPFTPVEEQYAWRLTETKYGTLDWIERS